MKSSVEEYVKANMIAMHALDTGASTCACISRSINININNPLNGKLKRQWVLSFQRQQWGFFFISYDNNWRVNNKICSLELILTIQFWKNSMHLHLRDKPY